VEDNGQFLHDLFAGPFRGHAIIMDPDVVPTDWSEGDFVGSEKPLGQWVGPILRNTRGC